MMENHVLGVNCGWQMGGLPFNKYSWLVTHNSFSIVDAPALPGVQRLTFYNQEDTVTNQLMVCISIVLHHLLSFEESIGNYKTRGF